MIPINIEGMSKMKWWILFLLVSWIPYFGLGVWIIIFYPWTTSGSEVKRVIASLGWPICILIGCIPNIILICKTSRSRWFKISMSILFFIMAYFVIMVWIGVTNMHPDFENQSMGNTIETIYS
ncbi:MAG: hypothetical protein ABSC11_05405 [Smithella sp.]|jgi:hypothetical protein